MSTLAWQQPLWGSVLQQPIGGSAPPDVGSSFVLYTRIVAPITSGANYENIALLTGHSGSLSAFVAPFDMTLKTMTERVTRTGGYRVETKFAYRLNGGTWTDMVTIAAATEGGRVHEVNVAISAGDEVEIGYNCGNNYNMGVGLGFFFEADGTDSSGGPFWICNQDTAVGSSKVAFEFGDGGSYNVFPMSPVTHVITNVTVGTRVAALTEVTFELLNTFSEYVPLGVLAIGETSETYADVNLPVLKGEVAPAVYGQAGGTESSYMAIMEGQIGSREDKPNQSAFGITDSDGKNAQTPHQGYFVAPTAGAFKEVYIGSPFSYGTAFPINIEINGVDTEIFNGTITGGTLEVLLPNLAFAAGDEIRIHHGGNNLTGGDLNISFLIETPYGAQYESPVWTAPVDPVAGGGESTFNMDNYTSSTSSNQGKGNFYIAREDRMVTKVRADSNTSGMTCHFWIAEVDENYEVVEVLHDGDDFTTGLSYQEEVLATPILFEQGKTYAVVIFRTDSTAMRMDYDRSPIAGDPDNKLLCIGNCLIVTDGVGMGVGDDIYYESTSVWDIGITSEAPNLEGKFNYWSLLVEGSDDGLAHSIAGLELRATPGGANLLTGIDQMYASAADDPADLPNLIDADAATVWEITDADFDATDRRLVFSLDSTTVQEIVINSDSGANYDKTPTDFKLQFSEDGLLWNDAFTVSGEAAWAADEERTYTRPQPVHDSDSAHRYWAVLGVCNTNGQSYMSTTECEMRETPAGANVATTGFAIDAGNTYSTGNEGDKAFDADTATYWQVQHSAVRVRDRWFGQDFGLGNEKTITEITLSARSGSQDLQTPTSGAVMYSDDGVTWEIAWVFYDITTWAALETRTFTKP